MARREYYHRPQCTYEGCNERAFYVSTSQREHRESVESVRRRGGWRCTRHSDPDAVLSAESPERETVVVSYETDHGYPDQGVNRYFAPAGADRGGNGFVYGPGFKAYAQDFPTGTRLIVTARVVLPGDSDAPEVAGT